MKKKLIEELERIHSITYGKNVILEADFINKLTGKKDTSNVKKIDDPKKADLVSDDVQEFFTSLENINSELVQQDKGSIDYQKDVETLQIALTLLGHELPRFGIDGKYGPETAAAVSEFKKENDIDTKINENSQLSKLENILNELEMVTLDDVSYSNVKVDNDSTRYDEINKALLDDLQKAASAADLTLTITTAKSGHSNNTVSGRRSRHADRVAVDIAILDGMGAKGASNSKNGNPQFRELGNRLKDALVRLGYVWNTESGNDKAVLWQTNTGGNHFNHLHVSNKVGASDAELDKLSKNSSGSVVPVEMVKVILEKLKQKGVKSEDLKKLTDSVVKGGQISLTGNWIDITKELFRKNEGYKEKAKWDENAYRGGYGTDKKLVNGRLINADSSTTWTKQEAEETMDYEIKNTYGPTVAKQVGLNNWNKLNDAQKASLVSLGYNAGPYIFTTKDYGKRIKSAIESGDMQAAADAIAQGPVTGSGTGKVYSGLQRRRREEAQIFMS